MVDWSLWLKDLLNDADNFLSDIFLIQTNFSQEAFRSYKTVYHFKQSFLENSPLQKVENMQVL